MKSKPKNKKICFKAASRFLSEIMDTYGRESLIQSIVDKTISSNMLSDVLNKAMTGELSKYFGMFLSGAKSALPVKTDAMRLFFMYMDSGLEDKKGLPEFMYTFRVAKYGLTAMGLAAQAIQHPMARAKTGLELAKLATERAVIAYDNNEDPENVSAFTSIAKYAATEAAYNACDISMQAHGGTAFDRDMGIICMWPLILLSRIIPLNNEVILERFSEAALGLPSSDLT